MMTGAGTRSWLPAGGGGSGALVLIEMRMTATGAGMARWMLRVQGQGVPRRHRGDRYKDWAPASAGAAATHC